ncbi:MAG: hypothetical protein HFK09_04960 [Clostridia bacterium]|nr:hypothetical protein [Clostridia bacterium]
MTKTTRVFKNFRKEMYRGDELYAGTAEFVTDMLVEQTTNFAKKCTVIPLAEESAEGRQAQCLWIHARGTDYAQIAFFDAQNKESAKCLIEKAKAITRKKGLGRIVAGLNGHLSYGVGILTSAKSKNTFDSCYNKLGYSEYFKDFDIVRTLSAYRCEVKEARRRLDEVRFDTSGYAVRTADFSKFYDECETMRRICDGTIGETYLYEPTECGHFYELLKDMKILLSGKNLLFLTYGGKDVGFLFWHPDYNGAIKAGKPYSAFSFALSYALRRSRADTVKLNSIGVESEHRGLGTLALLRAFEKSIGDRFEYIETNFVWDDNKKSALLNRKLLGEVCRTFAVYEEIL